MVSGNWWAMVLRGIAAVLFGLAALFWPGMTLLVLLVVFAVYALVDGLLAGLVVLFWPGTRRRGRVRPTPGERTRMSPVSSRVNIRARSPPSRIGPKARIAFVEAKRRERREWRRYRY